MDIISYALSKKHTDEALKNNISEEESLATGISKQQPEKSKIHQLLTGDDTGLNVSGGTLTYDDEYKKMGSKGLRFTSTGATTGSIIKYLDEHEKVDNYHSIGMWIYIEDVTKTNNLFVRIRDEDGNENVYSKGIIPDAEYQFKNGWNLIRWRAYNSSYNLQFGRVVWIRVMPIMTDATSIVIGGVWLESFEKAKLLFIHDGGYSEFFQEDGRGYEDLKARGIPLTIATIPKKIGDPENDRQISKSKLYELSLENNNEVSIHSYDGEDAIATMSESELREESYNAISLLQSWGYNPMWRSAWFRNNAPSAMGSTGLFHAFAFHNAAGFSNQERIEGFPFQNMYNVPRIQVHKRTNEDIDSHFDILKSTRGVFVGYTHNVVDDSSGDIDEVDWDYFLSKIDEGLEEGWLEGTTFKMLMQPYLDGLGTEITKI